MLKHLLFSRLFPVLLTLAALTVSPQAHAQNQKPEVEIDNGILQDLGTAHTDSTSGTAPAVALSRPGQKLSHPTLTGPDVPLPGMIVPAESASDFVTPAQPLPPPVLAPVAQEPAPAPVYAASKLPPLPSKKNAHAPLPERKPAAGEADASVRQFPISVKTRTDSINPAAPATALAPVPEVAASLAPSPPVEAKPASVPPTAKATVPAPSPDMPPMPPPFVTSADNMPPPAHETPPAQNLPPLPARRPAVTQASQAFVDKAREQVAKQAVIAATPGKPAGPAMPAEPPVPVTAVPLQDTLGQKIITPDRQKMVRDIEDISASVDKSSPPSSQKDSATIPDLTAVPDLTAKLVTTPAQNVQMPEITASTEPPSAASGKRGVPRPPPQDPHETNFFTLPFKPGVDQLDTQTTGVLQTQILPLFKDHPSWRLQIQSFASPTDKEPISARRISLARALALRSWLMDKGVEARRMDLRALGLETDRDPPDRVDMVFLDPNAAGG